MFEIFKNYNNLIIDFSEKKDGPMKFSLKNRERFFKKLGINRDLIIRAGLVHGNKIKIVANKDAGKLVKRTDGLITKEKNLFLTITTADCLPVFIYDPEKKIVGLVHGGWKSLANDILKEAINKMINNFKSRPGRILIGIGPGISKCHFEVKKDLLQKLCDRIIFARGVVLERDNKIFLDLKELARLQLIKFGVKKENIEISPQCTFCLENKYFSYRREKPKIVKTMIAVIGRK